MFHYMAAKKRLLLILLTAFSLGEFSALLARKGNDPESWPKDGERKWGVWTHNDRRGLKRKDPDDIG